MLKAAGSTEHTFPSVPAATCIASFPKTHNQHTNCLTLKSLHRQHAGDPLFDCKQKLAQVVERKIFEYIANRREEWQRRWFKVLLLCQSSSSESRIMAWFQVYSPLYVSRMSDSKRRWFIPTHFIYFITFDLILLRVFQLILPPNILWVNSNSNTAACYILRDYVVRLFKIVFFMSQDTWHGW